MRPRREWEATFDTRALERRRLRRTLPGLFDDHDLPLHAPYLDEVRGTGVEIRVQSRWLTGPQIRQLNLHPLHEAGFRGKGVRIGIIDTGFLLSHPTFHNPSHLLNVLAANTPGELMGTAPEAEYILLRAEDDVTEYFLEERWFVAALEFADAPGVITVGAVACLLQAYPDWTADQVREALFESGDFFREHHRPDLLFIQGFGVPDLSLAAGL